ncbi:MAG: hypothetical protein JXA04_05550 [Gammaproteobacteria bacterium]|nr:hypothetical protein [Gammaproteobacteria bacterium]
MHKSLLLLSTGLLATALSATAFAGDKPERCDAHAKKKNPVERLDADKDGNVSHDEFMANAEERFSKLDANSDGVIQKEEFVKAKKDYKDKKKDKMKAKESAKQ